MTTWWMNLRHHAWAHGELSPTPGETLGRHPLSVRQDRSKPRQWNPWKQLLSALASRYPAQEWLAIAVCVWRYNHTTAHSPLAEASQGDLEGHTTSRVNTGT